MTTLPSHRITSSAGETEELGALLAAELAPGSVVLVQGELGAGKTTLVRGAARALGVQDPVTSPTFTIANRYRTGEGRVAHLDLYRLADLAAEDPDLLEDYLDGEQVVFIEWPERGAQQLALAQVSVAIRHAGSDRREIAIECLAAGTPGAPDRAP